MAKLQAYKGNDPYIFISYAHRDNALVHPIIVRMQHDGYRIWLDEGIDPGTEWDENIANHIHECGYFIAFVSNNYLGSNNCKDELKYARDLSKKSVLVYLEEVDLTPGMAMRMNRIQSVFKYAYREENDFYEKLYESDDIDGFTSGKRARTDGKTVPPAQQTNVPTPQANAQSRRATPATKEKTVTYANGNTYTGEVNAEGKPHGNGTYRFSGGAIYEGGFSDGYRHGHGTFRYANGDVYEGEFEYNMRHGQCIFCYANGDSYEGAFQNNMRSGHGTYRYANGDVYRGEFKDDLQHGEGILFDKNGNVRKRGLWRHGFFAD